LATPGDRCFADLGLGLPALAAATFAATSVPLESFAGAVCATLGVAV